MKMVFNTLYALQINVIILKFSEAFHIRGCMKIRYAWLYKQTKQLQGAYTLVPDDHTKGKGYEPHSVKRSFLFLFGHEFPPLLPQWATEHFQLPSEDKSHLPENI